MKVPNKLYLNLSSRIREFSITASRIILTIIELLIFSYKSNLSKLNQNNKPLILLLDCSAQKQKTKCKVRELHYEIKKKT